MANLDQLRNDESRYSLRVDGNTRQSRGAGQKLADVMEQAMALADDLKMGGELPRKHIVIEDEFGDEVARVIIANPAE